jgi:hypothetical protein
VASLQANDFRAGEIALEPEDVADLGAAPAVDGLIVIADAADVAMLAREQAQPQILRDIGVLVFVNQQVPELPLIPRQDLGLLRKQRDRMQQQVAEIAGVQRAQSFLILAVERDSSATGEFDILGRAYLLRRKPAILPALDHGEQRPCRPAFFIDLLRLQELLQQSDLVVGVEDGEAWL